MDGSVATPLGTPSTPERLQHLLQMLETDLGGFEEAFDAFVHEFAERAKQERTERRAQIARENPGVTRTFSPNVITYRFHHGSVELGWAELWYKPGDPQVRFRRIPLKKGVAHVAAVVRRAHPDEVDLLRQHEERARQYRQLWTAYLQLRRNIAKFRRMTAQAVESLFPS